jgi:hypothetical protein
VGRVVIRRAFGTDRGEFILARRPNSSLALGRRELRTRLIECYLNFAISKELSEWLQDLGLPSTGTTREKLNRLRQMAGSLVLPAESFARRTIYYLDRYDEDILAEICEELGIDETGPGDSLVGYPGRY